MVLACGELAGADSLGMERIGLHGFPCVLRHPSPRQLQSTALCHRPSGPADLAPEGDLRPGPLPQLRQLPVGQALPPRSMGASVALGVGLGVNGGARGRVMGTGG